VTLKFIFANHDQRVNVEIATDLSAKIGEVKAALLGLWPAGERATAHLPTHTSVTAHLPTHTSVTPCCLIPDVPAVEDSSRVRLICMGLGALNENKTLKDCRVPAFSTHPTPVNVSIRPADIPAPPSKEGDRSAVFNCATVLT
jgi:hypothetical protein